MPHTPIVEMGYRDIFPAIAGIVSAFPEALQIEIDPGDRTLSQATLARKSMLCLQLS